MLACHCLNVIIEFEDDLHKIETSTAGFSSEEVEDSFFKQEIQQVGKLVNISKSHSGFVQTRNVDSWIVHYCINCGIHTHALHREKGASCVLVNGGLLGKEAIERAKNSKNFSRFFKILVDSNATLIEDDLATTYVPSEVENAVRGLKQVAAEALKKEAAEVERRIKQFEDEQYGKLSDLREKTFREQQILSKVILNYTIDHSKPTSTNLTMSYTLQAGIPSRINEPLGAGSGKVPASPTSAGNQQRHTPKRQKSHSSALLSSFDTEGLFQFDGINDGQSGTGSEIEETSDIDESGTSNIDESGVNIVKKSLSSNPVAKSLPMRIPPFLSQPIRSRNFEDVDDIIDPLESNMDIAASMKALAKSVHGDPVFGDLPKPRYTYI